MPEAQWRNEQPLSMMLGQGTALYLDLCPTPLQTYTLTQSTELGVKWYSLVTPAFGELRQEGGEPEASSATHGKSVYIQTSKSNYKQQNPRQNALHHHDEGR